VDLDTFREMISNYGLDPEKVLNILKDIYLADELPYEVCSGEPTNIQCTKYYDADKKMLNVLHDLGIISINAKGTYRAASNIWIEYKQGNLPLEYVEIMIKLSGRVWFLSLTNKGCSITKKYLRHYLDNNKEILYKILTIYPKELIGFLSYITEDSYVRNIEAIDTVIEEILPIGMDYKYWLNDLINTIDPLHSKVLELLKDLSRIGLSIYIPAYDSKGIYLYHKYSTSGLVINYCASLVKACYPEDIINTLYGIYLITRARTNNEFMEILRKIVLEHEDFRRRLQILLDVLYSKGIATRLNVSSDPSIPLFIVMDRNEFEKYITEIIKNIVNRLIQATQFR